MGLSYHRAVKLIGEPHRCAICGGAFPERLKKPMNSTWYEPTHPTIDHILPKSKGGKNNKDNIQWAHAKCNSERSDKPPRHGPGIIELPGLTSEPKSDIIQKDEKADTQ